MVKSIKLCQKILYRIKQIFSVFCQKLRNKVSQKSEEEKALVIDTCCLKAKNAIKLIDSYSRVIILRETIDEIDRKKTQIEKALKAETIFTKNARILLSIISRDRKNNKIQIVNWYCKSKHVYVDNSIIDFCKNKNVILFTGDYGLASRAKGYNIEYILTDEVNSKLESIIEEEKLKEKQEETNQYEEYVSVNAEDLRRKIEQNSFAATKSIEEYGNTIRNASMVGKNLVLIIPDTTKIKYITIQDGHVKKNMLTDNMIKLEKGDIVVILTYRSSGKYLQVLALRVTQIREEKHAEYVGSKKLHCLKDIEELIISEDIKREIRNYFVLTNLN